jgi:hypothetical protein
MEQGAEENIGPKREEGVVGWRRLHNGELHNFYALSNVIRVFKSLTRNPTHRPVTVIDNFFRPFRKIVGYYLKIYHSRFHPHSLEFIVQNYPNIPRKLVVK